MSKTKMKQSELEAISPIDGRYRSKTAELAPFFSESALIRYRVQVEIEYFIALCEIPLEQLPVLDDASKDALRGVYLDFASEDAQKIKDIEQRTNHDVKAVEYFVKQRIEDLGYGDKKEFVHFGLTSQDINNTAIPLSLKGAMNDVYVPHYLVLTDTLSMLAKQWKEIPMLARTHGQPASPTRLGKEIDVFVKRLAEQFNLLNDIPSAAKFGGASGNLNAHHVAYPAIDWHEFANRFVQEKLGLYRSYPTTQIEHYDHMAALFDALKRINTILIDLNRDLWTYISMNYFKQKIKSAEVGSSAMPHKVNPIDFENAEGNLGLANALFTHLSSKLPVSRLQRDLTDSTVLRNIGLPFSHTLIAFKSTVKGLNKLVLNEEELQKDLHGNWAVVAEAIQTILRREGYPQPYEALKELTRTNGVITQQMMLDFIDDLQLEERIKKELKAITPDNYTGI